MDRRSCGVHTRFLPISLFVAEGVAPKTLWRMQPTFKRMQQPKFSAYRSKTQQVSFLKKQGGQKMAKYSQSSCKVPTCQPQIHKRVFSWPLLLRRLRLQIRQPT